MYFDCKNKRRLKPPFVFTIKFYKFKGKVESLCYFCVMERIVSLVKNRFLISGVAFLIWMFFFDRYDVATQIGYQQERNKLEQEKAFYSSETENIEKAIKDAQYNPSEIQRIAREKYKMKKANEDVYVITEIDPKD